MSTGTSECTRRELGSRIVDAPSRGSLPVARTLSLRKRMRHPQALLICRLLHTMLYVCMYVCIYIYIYCSAVFCVRREAKKVQCGLAPANRIELQFCGKEKPFWGGNYRLFLSCLSMLKKHVKSIKKCCDGQGRI